MVPQSLGPYDPSLSAFSIICSNNILCTQEIYLPQEEHASSVIMKTKTALFTCRNLLCVLGAHVAQLTIVLG